MRTKQSPGRRARLARGCLIALAALLLAACAFPAPAAPAAGASSSNAPDPSVYPREAERLPAVQFDDLPREAKRTIILIECGGPFPYDQDGQTFQNREGILPDRPTGYYEEYTVETPGSADRGARRIVAGDKGERYYTDDHYDSFSRVMP
jgi:ribonuclease T1